MEDSPEKVQYLRSMQWPLSMSGRHPNSKGHLIPMQYATMALSDTPDGSEEVDAEMAEAYLRLVSGKAKEKDEGPEYIPVISSKAEMEMRNRFLNMGYAAEMDPQGTLALGYGSMQIMTNTMVPTALGSPTTSSATSSSHCAPTSKTTTPTTDLTNL